MAVVNNALLVMAAELVGSARMGIDGGAKKQREHDCDQFFHLNLLGRFPPSEPCLKAVSAKFRTDCFGATAPPAAIA